MAAASAESCIDGPGLPVRTISPSTMSSASAVVCISSAAAASASPRSLTAAMRVASPHITVTREAKAPMPLSMRSVWPCTTLMPA